MARMPEHTPAQPPIATKKPVTRSFHGRDFVDDYEWLRDKESPETIAYLADPASAGVTGQVVRVCGQNIVGQ